jgi:guanylate kinase
MEPEMSLILDAWTQPDRGALFVVTGASGTGKTTLVKQALRRFPGLEFSCSATTREPRRGEIDGVDYHYLGREGFARLLDRGAFLEWAEVYGNRYGTLKEPVVDALAAGKSVLLEIDMQGARQVRANMPESVSIFVLPPDLATIEARLRGRSTDSEAIIQRRLADAMIQIGACGEFDYLVVNDDLPTAHDCFQAVIAAELMRRDRRESLVRHLNGTT